MLIKLTSFETGVECYINPQDISLVQRLPKYSNDLTGEDVSERTKLVVASYVVLVNETPAEIMEIMTLNGAENES